MGVRSVTNIMLLHVIIAYTVFILQIIEHTEAATSPIDSSLSSFNVTYIQIDHELIPRKIENINDLSPLPVPLGRDSAMRKYPVNKRNIQEIILEIDENKESNNINNYDYQTQSNSEGESWKNESKIRQSKLKSILGTEGEVYYDGDWGLMSAVLTCYNNHWVLKTGPEDWWTVVIRTIVQAMDKYGEVPQVRNFFVEHKGKKKLEVFVGPTLSNVNYNWLFSQFSNRIRENIKIPSYVDIIENDFSSSTQEQTMISHIMLMSSVKNYFQFGMSSMCGIPGIEMKGTVEDWVKLNDKINKLKTLLSPINKYLHLNNWFNTAKSVFSNLLETYKGKPNTEWWGKILSWEERYGSGMQPHWSGWFPKFVGASYQPGEYVDFSSDLVTVPLHISDPNNAPPVEDDGILISGIVGFHLKEGVRAPVVEPNYAWSLLLPEDSPVAERLTGKIVSGFTRRDGDGTPHRMQPTDPITNTLMPTPLETQTDHTSISRFLPNRIPYETFNASITTPAEIQIGPYQFPAASSPSCGKCRINSKRLKAKKYCKREYAVVIRALSKEIQGKYTVFNIQVMNVYKRAPHMPHLMTQLWVKNADLACKCPRIDIGKKFLILGDREKKHHFSYPGFIINRRSLVIEGSDDWKRRMRRFLKKAGNCSTSRFAPIIFPSIQKNKKVT